MTAQPAFEVFSADLGFIEGPVWNAEAGTLSLVSIDRGVVYTLDGAGRRIATVRTEGGPNGMVLGQAGLVVAQNGGIFGAGSVAKPGVQLIDGEGARYIATEGFVAPNDIAFGLDGRLYVTDPKSERAIMEPVEGQVLACDPVTGATEVVIAGRLCPNGLAFTKDGSELLLALTQRRVVERFAVTATGLKSRGLFCELTNGRPDGMAIDQAGQVWLCTPGTGGVEVFDGGGSFLRRIEIGAGSMTTNLCFGGPDMRDLFVTAAGWGQVLRIAVDVPGLELSRGPKVDR